MRDELHGSATAYGVIGMAAAAGIAVGALLGGRDADTARRLRWIVLSAGVIAAAVVVAGLAPSLLLLGGVWSVLGVANGALNTSTAFLGSIIVGNGINYPILVLTRYDEERAAGQPVAAAVSVAVSQTARATALVRASAKVKAASVRIITSSAWRRAACRRPS